MIGFSPEDSKLCVPFCRPARRVPAWSSCRNLWTCPWPLWGGRPGRPSGTPPCSCPARPLGWQGPPGAEAAAPAPRTSSCSDSSRLGSVGKRRRRKMTIRKNCHHYFAIMWREAISRLSTWWTVWFGWGASQMDVNGGPESFWQPQDLKQLSVPRTLPLLFTANRQGLKHF